MEFAAGGFIEAGSMPKALMCVMFLLMIAGGVGESRCYAFPRMASFCDVAPTPVSALLHAVAVVKAGVSVY